MSKLKLGINEISNREYHEDTEYFSSTNIKDAIKDPEKLYKQKILKESIVQGRKSHFDEGSLTHSMILEPHLTDKEFMKSEAWRRNEKIYKEDVECNPGRIVMTTPQWVKVKKWVASFFENPVAPKMIEKGEAEHTLCVILDGIPVKIRCDKIDVENGMIFDIKTSGFPVDHYTFKSTVKQWEYDLSAALYLKAAEEYYKKPFDFYFGVIGKSELITEVYKLSDKTRKDGDLKIAQGFGVIRKMLNGESWEDVTKKKEHVSEEEYEILEV